MNALYHDHEKGFTLVEVLITLGIAMFVLAGMSAMFVSQARTAQALSKKSEAMNDLFLASQIMQFELRGAKAMCWDDGNQTLRYQPLSSVANLQAVCSSTDAANGWFDLRANTAVSPTPYICWDMPNDGTNCQELIRDLKAGNLGLTVSPVDNTDLQAVRTITLTAQYKDRDMQVQDLQLSFKVWPRNVQ